jgi:hypothetical protein
MRRAIECGVVFTLLLGCSNGLGDGDVARRGETETEGSSGESGESLSTSKGVTSHDDVGECNDNGGGLGCVRTQGYWKNHSVYAEHEHQRIPWPIDENTVLCEHSWYEWLWTAPEGDGWIILVHQYIAAQLNVAAGAEASSDMQGSLDEAGAVLEACVVADHAAATELADLLDGWNNGQMGVAPCDGHDEGGGGDDDDDDDDDEDDDGKDEHGHDKD